MKTKALIKKWKGNQRYTIKLVEAMPDEQFNFKPTDGVKTFQSHVSHIATWLRTHSRFATGKELEKIPTKTKNEIIESLNDLFDELIEFLKSASEEELSKTVKVWYGTVSREAILLTMDNHLAHHRGQMVVYLRLCGVKPPSYIGW